MYMRSKMVFLHCYFIAGESVPHLKLRGMCGYKSNIFETLFYEVFRGIEGTVLIIYNYRIRFHSGKIPIKQNHWFTTLFQVFYIIFHSFWRYNDVTIYMPFLVHIDEFPSLFRVIFCTTVDYFISILV